MVQVDRPKNLTHSLFSSHADVSPRSDFRFQNTEVKTDCALMQNDELRANFPSVSAGTDVASPVPFKFRDLKVLR